MPRVNTTKIDKTPIVPVGPSIAYLPLGSDFYALIDSADVETLSVSPWHSAPAGSGLRYVWRKSPIAGLRIIPSLHRFLLRPEGRLQVDHINGNGLDNRRANLRLATPAENSRNRKRMPSKTGFKGVVCKSGRFSARITMNRKHIHIGTFSTADSAARAYDSAALKHYGTFAQLNFKESINA